MLILFLLLVSYTDPVKVSVSGYSTLCNYNKFEKLVKRFWIVLNLTMQKTLASNNKNILYEVWSTREEYPYAHFVH